MLTQVKKQLQKRQQPLMSFRQKKVMTVWFSILLL